MPEPHRVGADSRFGVAKLIFFEFWEAKMSAASRTVVESLDLILTSVGCQLKAIERKIESDPCRKTKPPGESDFEITKRIAHTLQALVNLLLKQFPKV